MSHHSLVAYRTNLRTHAEAVAFKMPAAGATGTTIMFAPRPGLGECPARPSSSRGAQGPGLQGSQSADAMEQLAQVVGQHGRQVISQLSESGWAGAGAAKHLLIIRFVGVEHSFLLLLYRQQGNQDHPNLLKQTFLTEADQGFFLAAAAEG